PACRAGALDDFRQACHPGRLAAVCAAVTRSPPMTAKDIPSWRLALILAALSMFGPFTIDTIFPAFGVIERDFGISAVAMQQTISVYLVAYALASVFHGPLSDAYGRKPVILVGVG